MSARFGADDHQVAPALRAGASFALQQLRQGELTLEQYLETRVEAGVQHLVGLLSEGKLEIVRDVLREALRSDPVTLEHLRRAIGSVRFGQRSREC